MTTQPQLPIAPLPICPPLIPGESFTSWMNRIAFRCQLPLGMILARLNVAPSSQHSDMPNGYGLRLTATQRTQIAAITGMTENAVAGSLLTAYRGGPLDLGALDDVAVGAPLGDVLRDEWLHLRRSAYCPDCLRETGGAWQLRWRLPWSFACTTHRVLLGSTCPACQLPAAQGKGNRSTQPHFIALVPDPERCGNAIAGADVGYVGRPGRAARPCGHNLADSITATLDNLRAEPILDAQNALNGLLADGGQRDAWMNLRAFVTVLMYFADTGTLTDIAADLTASIFTIPSVLDAIAVHDDGRQDRIAQQQRVREGGLDHRTGFRQRYGTATPTSPGLMAVLGPLALRLHGPLPGDGTPPAGQSDLADQGLNALVRLARTSRRQLPVMLAAAGASASLFQRAENAARATGKFTYSIQNDAAHDVTASAIPAYLWEEQAAPFIACLPDTRDDTTRKFASLHLVKTLTGDTWQQAAVRLGHPTGPIPTLTANLVNRMTVAGTQAEFRAAAHNVLTRLSDGDLPTVDYAHRRRALHSLRSIPAEVLHAGGTAVATASRRRCSAAWLWAHLTGGHPYEAPAWGSGDATPNQREVYRRYVRHQLSDSREAILTYGKSLLQPEPAQS